jgi:hypothetical protein
MATQDEQAKHTPGADKADLVIVDRLTVEHVDQLIKALHFFGGHLSLEHTLCIERLVETRADGSRFWLLRIVRA